MDTPADRIRDLITPADVMAYVMTPAIRNYLDYQEALRARGYEAPALDVAADLAAAAGRAAWTTALVEAGGYAHGYPVDDLQREDAAAGLWAWSDARLQAAVAQVCR